MYSVFLLNVNHNILNFVLEFDIQNLTIVISFLPLNLGTVELFFSPKHINACVLSIVICMLELYVSKYSKLH